MFQKNINSKNVLRDNGKPSNENRLAPSTTTIIGFNSSEDSSVDEESNYFGKQYVNRNELSNDPVDIIHMHFQKYLQPSNSKITSSDEIDINTVSDLTCNKNLKCEIANIELRKQTHDTFCQTEDDSFKDFDTEQFLIQDIEIVSYAPIKDLDDSQEKQKSFFHAENRDKLYQHNSKLLFRSKSTENLSISNTHKNLIDESHQFSRKHNCWLYNGNETKDTLKTNFPNALNSFQKLTSYTENSGENHILFKKRSLAEGLKTNSNLIPYKPPGEDEILHVLTDDSDKSDITTKVRHVSGKDADELDVQNASIIPSQLSNATTAKNDFKMSIITQPSFEQQKFSVDETHLTKITQENSHFLTLKDFIASQANKKEELNENKINTVADIAKTKCSKQCQDLIQQSNVFSSLAVEYDEESEKSSTSSETSPFSIIHSKNISQLHYSSQHTSPLSNSETTSSDFNNFALDSQAAYLEKPSQNWKQLRKKKSVANEVSVQTNISAGDTLHYFLTKSEDSNNNSDANSTSETNKSKSNLDKSKIKLVSRTKSSKSSRTVDLSKKLDASKNRKQSQKNPLIMETHRKKYINKLQNEIEWLEKVEQLLYNIKNEVSLSSVERRCTLERSSSTSSYNSHQGNSKSPELINAVVNQMEKTNELLNEFPSFNSDHESNSKFDLNILTNGITESKEIFETLSDKQNKIKNSNNSMKKNSSRNTNNHPTVTDYINLYDSSEKQFERNFVIEPSTSTNAKEIIFHNERELSEGNIDIHHYLESNLKFNDLEDMQHTDSNSINSSSNKSAKDKELNQKMNGPHSLNQKCSKCHINDEVLITSRSIQTSPIIAILEERLSENKITSERCFVTLPTKQRKSKTPLSSFSKQSFWTNKINNSVPINKKEITSFSKWKDKQPIVFTYRKNVEKDGVSWFVPLNEKLKEEIHNSHVEAVASEMPQENMNALCQPMEKLSLQDACRHFKKNFITKSMHRLQNVKSAAQTRKHQVYQAQELLIRKLKCNKTQTSLHCNQLHKPKKRFFTHHEMRKQTEMRYRILPEIISAKEVKRKQEQYVTNRIMAELYKRKILEKTLQGKVSYLITDRCI